MRIILIGNYPPDKQESMIRFAEMLNAGFRESGLQTEIWWPTVFFGTVVKVTNTGLGKWIGYFDKWIVFPLILWWRLQTKTLLHSRVQFHICDHSNSLYLKYLPTDQTSITCHDVLAIRGSLGYTDAYAPASGFGKILQKWILYYLIRAKKMASVSQLTLNQLQELGTAPINMKKEWRVIHNAFNADFKPIAKEKFKNLLNKVGFNTEMPFLLHVGSGQPRKNRGLLLLMVKALGSKWAGNVVLAGEAVDEAFLKQAEALGLRHRVISVVKPNHDTLVALYNACDAFVFPSFSEGFGWPIIEAQACGAPVITSNIEPMPEVSGGGALLADPNSPADFANAFLALHDLATRAILIKRGFENAKRFELRQMVAAYLQLYGMKEVKA
ncbi:glycosyltransferase family 4 protein [Adhaeribacter pallidiroseus]|uniref:D-inositol-3-phosphate glycosyltransferase n=1 Tax=Adhaeribacter pallidiroseus TaxID=2072847 RepID=A0A369QQZ3_9BACT|nr:glycosyltransferase family 1 protein [Adhaeribacter pallidiroseus]RDC66095.1 D-inositol-3-phosphate glycosyltransferase [Adhaeribacter pallidiroseus]